MEVALDLINYSSEESSSDLSSLELSPLSESDAACCCCSDTSGEEICCNWEISKSGWIMSISCSCLRMIRSLRRRALMRTSLDCYEELLQEDVGALVRDAGGGIGAGVGAGAGGVGFRSTSLSVFHWPYGKNCCALGTLKISSPGYVGTS
ncbi:hypothetical protein PIB30_077252 [Stylosanthes scabra]|uniref:Uncharacterized protein n=1 Tax=Stylosanthes scabra TaxID=79078 RepID=A0ABU6VNZ6_9FABA|nr:hypothetical protein [Stylosanthes scabra]